VSGKSRVSECECVKDALETLYRRLNRREFVHPDPLEFLYHYRRPPDREVVAFVASALAYGRVQHILTSVAKVLDVMTPSPRAFLASSPADHLKASLARFRHRFTTGPQVSGMLAGIKGVLARHGSLNNCFLAGLGDEGSILKGISFLVEEIRRDSPEPLDHLVPLPCRGSACKRLHLFLRWVVRRDAVDPGGWEGVPCSRLMVPVDTHMHRVGLCLGFTERRSADARTASEITEGFRAVAPEDPVKYDFCLTRLGIRKDGGLVGPAEKGR
jgi:uncharacterized protein (TIGR02757 family)